MKIEINKVDFIEIVEDEMDFMGHKFPTKDEDEIERRTKGLINRYYDSLSYMTSTQLKEAFKGCREHFTYFPRISQVLKYGAPKKLIENPTLPTRPIMTRAMSKKISDITSQKGNFKIEEGEMEHMKHMVRARWLGEDFREVFKRWDIQNEARPNRR